MALQFRRGTDAERAGTTFKPGEPIFVTDTGKLYIGDGTTQGGTLLPAGLSDDPNPSLASSLDLAGNNIIGTGSINITGNIDATGYINAKGNITLGDASEDNVIVGGVIGSSLIPDADGLYDLGDNLSHWRTGYFEGITVNGEIQANSISVNNIIGLDSTEILNLNTGSLSIENIETTSIQGDLIGSVFGNDSTTIIDGITNKLLISEIESIDTSLRIISEQIDVSMPKTDSFPLMILRVYNDSIEDPTEFSAGDSLGGYQIEGYVQDESKFGGIFAAAWSEDADFNTSRPKSRVVLQAGNNDETADVSLAAFLEGDGTFQAPILKTGSYADESERDSAIPNPQEGMIILLRGLQDSTENPRFQGYDGISWVDLA
jgi:hypothetical protein